MSGCGGRVDVPPPPEGIAVTPSRGTAFASFVPSDVTPIIPGAPLPETITLRGALATGQVVTVSFALLDPASGIHVTLGDQVREIALDEAADLFSNLADRFIASPETLGGFVPVLDRLGFLPGVLPAAPAGGPGNTEARAAEACQLGLELDTLDLDGMIYSFVHGGRRSQPAVLFLAGTPDSWHVWRNQLRFFRQRGYRVIAVDLPGMGESIGPAGIERYNHRRIAADLVTLLDHLHVDRVNVVGHDWGALLAWDLAAFPETASRVRRLAVLTTGHPAVYTQSTPVIEALGKLWYHSLLANSFSGAAEHLFRRNNWALFDRLVFEHPESAYWKRDLARTEGLSNFRKIFAANSNNFFTPDFQTVPRVRVPTLGLLSDGDLRYLSKEQMTQSSQLVDAPFQFELIRGASHWMQVDKPARVNQLLAGFLD